MLIKPRGRNIFHFIDLMSWKYKAGLIRMCFREEQLCLSAWPRWAFWTFRVFLGILGEVPVVPLRMRSRVGRRRVGVFRWVGRDDVDTAAGHLFCWLFLLLLAAG